MKKSLLTLVLGLLISVSAMAQSKNEKRFSKMTDKKIEKIELVTKLSDSEKETFHKLNKAYLTKHFSLKELKESNPAEFKTEIKANKNNLETKLIAAFGKKRATEILNAGKKKKKKKKN
jgi:hypothetical protein